MLYMVPLAIYGATNIVIALVNGPVALLRGGASPVPRAFIG